MWDVGGQKSLRSYWRNYFECTDGLIWVVDSADKRRLDDCMKELHALLLEEVILNRIFMSLLLCLCKYNILQRLAGATLLIFANKQDLPGAYNVEQLKEVRNILLQTHKFIDIYQIFRPWNSIKLKPITGKQLHAVL